MLPLLYLWDSKAMYIGLSFETVVHAHNAAQIIVALEGTIKVEIENSWLENSIFVIRPNTKHRIRLYGTVALLLIDAEDTRMEFDSITGELSRTTMASLKNCYARAYSTEEALQLFHSIISDIGLSEKINPVAIDERIQRCLEYIEQNLKEDLSMESICKINGISESSFSHMFSKEVGLPFRRYLLWKRLKESIAVFLREKKSLTEISVEMGFSDQAHFSNSFKDVFGVKPTFIFRNKLRILYGLNRIKIS